MYEYYDNYLAAKGNADAQSRWVRQLTWEVARHAVGEEIVVYPLMEKHLGAEGRELTDHDRAEHQVRSQWTIIFPTNIDRSCPGRKGTPLQTRGSLRWYYRV